MSAGSSLKICHLGKFYPPAPGGMETHVQTLAREQAALGHEVRVVCVNHRGVAGRDVTWRMAASTPTVDEFDGLVRVRRLGRIASVSRLDICPNLAVTLAQLAHSNTDIVHVHAPNPTMYLALAARPLKAPLFVTYQSDVVKQRALGAPYSLVEYFVHSRSAAVFVASEQYVGGSPKLLRIASKVRQLPLGLDLKPFFEPTDAAEVFTSRLRSEQGSPLWLAVGRLVYYKGFETAIDALARVPGRLVIVGRGPLRQDLTERARGRGVDSRISWFDYMSGDELAGAYHAATAFWFPSNARSEAFGLVQVEAMASGCPVLNTHIPNSGVPWVARHEREALTSAPNDAFAFAAHATRLLEDPGLRRRLSDGGRARAAAEFDSRVMASRCIAYYEEVVGRRTGLGRVPVASSPADD